MLDTLAHAMRLYLKDRGCPLPVEYGPLREAQYNLRSRIVFERDRVSGDSYVGPRDRAVYAINQTQRQGCVCSIVAKSGRAGADVSDHEDMADRAAKMVVIGLRECLYSEPGDKPWLGLVGPTTFQISSAGILSQTSLAPLKEIQQWAACVYQIRFSFDVGITDENWSGDLPVKGDIAGLSTILRSVGPWVNSLLPSSIVRLYHG